MESLQNDETKSFVIVDNLQNESLEKINTEYFNLKNTVCIAGIWIFFITFMLLISTGVLVLLCLNLRNKIILQKKKQNSFLNCLNIYNKKKIKESRTSSDITSIGDNVSSYIIFR